MGTIYDLIILGAGPAGLAAGLYGGRYRLDTLLIETGGRLPSHRILKIIRARWLRRRNPGQP